jgi:putative hydrolase of the HAD superfamily
VGYKTVIFDLGNVLVSFSHEKMFSQIATLTGLSADRVQDLMVEQRIGHQYERGLLTSFEIHSLLQEKAPKSFLLPELIDAASSIFSPRTEMETLVATLKNKGYQLLLISNTIHPHFDHIKTHFSFLPYFDHTILSYEVGARKPEKAIFEYALKQAGAKPSDCFFIDDLIENVHAAESLGIHSHHFTTPSHLMEDLIQAGIL